MNEQYDIEDKASKPPQLKFESIDLDPAIDALERPHLGLERGDMPGHPPSLIEPAKTSQSQGADTPQLPELMLLNPTGGEFRQPDARGQGHFGAPRGSRLHKGQDIVGQSGQDVLAPMSGVVTKIGYSYDDDLSFRYIHIKGEEASARVHYVKPSDDIKLGSEVERGEVIGSLLSLKERYPGITDHAHLELWVEGSRIDPAPYVVHSADAELVAKTSPEANVNAPEL